MDTTNETKIILELQRKIDILWKIANICPKCEKIQMRMDICAIYPPRFLCPVCDAEVKVQKASCPPVPAPAPVPADDINLSDMF